MDTPPSSPPVFAALDRLVRILGGDAVLGCRMRSSTDLRRAVEAGLPLASLDAAVDHVAGTDTTLAGELRHAVVPRTTLHRRQERAEPLSPEESERLERLARLAALAEMVWEDEALAREYLLSRQPQLDGERPMDLIRSELGAREVEARLWAMEFALPA